MPKSNRKRHVHPYLYTNGREIFSIKHMPVIGLEPVRATRHHLYPRERCDLPGVNKEQFLLSLWGYRHFNGWNKLFQFSYMENGTKERSELTIDEIITLMAIRHPFITEKVGTAPWKVLFRNLDLDGALDLLCRMLAMKFNYQWQQTFPKQITCAVRKAA